MTTACMERSGTITFQGNPLTLIGPELEIGQQAPDFTALNQELAEVRLSDFAGKTVLISVVPSLDTPVCDQQTRRFNEEAAKLSNTTVLTLSMDLPFAQSRWCGGAGVENLTTLSDHREASFGSAYGLLIKELRLLTRAILIISPEGTLAYQEIVPEITDYPDYDAALAALN